MRNAKQLGTQCVVVDVGDQRVHDPNRDGARQHRRRDSRGLGGVVDQHAVEALNELLKLLMIG
jgi:hypothetical protein